MKVYGAPICKTCVFFKRLMQDRGFTVEYNDITETLNNMREFLKYRDTDPVFEPAKARGGIGIPFFVREDGKTTLDMDEALGWIGQPPVSEDEKETSSQQFVCAGCK